MRTCGNRASAFRSAPAKRMVVVAAKPGIHPEFFPEAPVVCNGVQVMTVGGTKPSYNVDVYSGNHPFYQGQRTALVIDEGQLNKFKNRFAALGDAFTQVGAAASIAGKAVDESVKKEGKGKGKGKK